MTGGDNVGGVISGVDEEVSPVAADPFAASADVAADAVEV